MHILCFICTSEENNCTKGVYPPSTYHFQIIALYACYVNRHQLLWDTALVIFLIIPRYTQFVLVQIYTPQ